MTKSLLSLFVNKRHKFKNALTPLESQTCFSIEVVFIEEYRYAIGELQLTRKSNGNKRQKIRIKKIVNLTNASYVCLMQISDGEKS